MNKLKEKLKLLNLQSFGERVYEQEIHCMFCGKKVLREQSCLYEVLEAHKYCEHILFLQHQDGFEHIRDDIRQSKLAKEMIEHFAECEKCGVSDCKEFEDLSKEIILNDSFVVLYQYSQPYSGWNMIGFSPYKINELNLEQIATKHNEQIKNTRRMEIE